MTKSKLVLGLHPSSRGFGWALLDGPQSLLDYGSSEIRGTGKNAQALARIETLLKRYRPGILALESFDDAASRRRPRVRRLYRTLIARAHRRGMRVRVFSKAEIATSFGVDSRNRRHAVAAAVAERLEALGPRLPKPQKIWLGEDHDMGLFCAAACALVCYDKAASLSKESKTAH